MSILEYLCSIQEQAKLDNFLILLYGEANKMFFLIKKVLDRKEILPGREIYGPLDKKIDVFVYINDDKLKNGIKNSIKERFYSENLNFIEYENFLDMGRKFRPNSNIAIFVSNIIQAANDKLTRYDYKLIFSIYFSVGEKNLGKFKIIESDDRNYRTVIDFEKGTVVFTPEFVKIREWMQKKILEKNITY